MCKLFSPISYIFILSMVSGGSLKAAVLGCEVQTLCLREKLGTGAPFWGGNTRDGASGESVTQCFLCNLMYFLCHPRCRSHSASFWISLRGNCSVNSCIFGVSVGRMRFWSHQCHLCHKYIFLISVMKTSGMPFKRWVKYLAPDQC